jgi:pimeloyl-ACP methyl ester carboxylesterase
MFRTVNGRRLQVEALGKGPFALVFLHGLGASPYLWHAQLVHFGASLRVIAPRLRGHAPSALGGPYSVPDLAADVSALFDDLGVSRCVVVGSSFAVGVAVHLAAERPDLVAGLVGDSGFVRQSAVQLHVIERVLGRLRVDGPASMSRRLSDLCFAGRTHAELGGIIGLHRVMLEANDPAAYVSFWEELRTYDITPLLHRVRCPTLLIAGAEDRVNDPSAQRDLLEGIPHATAQVFSDAGHLPFLEQSTRFNRALEEFVLHVTRGDVG